VGVAKIKIIPFLTSIFGIQNEKSDYLAKEKTKKIPQLCSQFVIGRSIMPMAGIPAMSALPPKADIGRA